MEAYYTKGFAIFMNSQKSSEIEKPFSNFHKIFQSTPKFMIYVLLSIYGEMSLTELSETLKRKKSTLSAHLNQMIKSDLVEVSKRVKVRGDKKAKYYQAIGNFEEQINEYLDSINLNKNPEKKDLQMLQMRILFSELNITFLKKWQEYNQFLVNEIQEGRYEKRKELIQALDAKKNENIIFSIFQHYSKSHALKLREDTYDLFMELDKSVEQTDKQQHADFYSHFCSLNIIPMSLILNHYLKD